MANQQDIYSVLEKVFKPTQLEVIDESHFHAGHNVEAQKGGTHFKIMIESQVFKGKRLIESHRLIYDTLQAHKITYHALAIKIK